MPLQVICPGCKQPLQLPDGSHGKQVRCPKCQAIFGIGPARPPAPSPAPIAIIPLPAPPKTQPQASDSEIPPRPPKKVIADDEDRPRTRSKSKREPADQPREEEAPALHLVLGVSYDPDREMKGDYVGELTGGGLRMRQGDDKIRVKVGSPVLHRRRNQIEIDVDGRPVQFLVKGFARGEGPPLPAQMAGLRINRHRLAADLTAFLRGDRDEPLRVGDYVLPWYLFAVGALPLGIPIITLGGWIPVIGAILLSGGALAIVQRDHWPVLMRLAASLGLSIVGYGVVIGLYALVSYISGPTLGGAEKPTILEKEWQTYKSPDGDFDVQLPGKPEALPDLAHGVQVKIDRPEVTFRVHYFTVPAARRPDLTDGAVRREIPIIWPEMLAPIRHDYSQSKQFEGSLGQKGDDLIYDFRVADSNPKRDHMMVTEIQYNRFGDRVYCASVSTTGEMEYDVIKFFKSVHVTYHPK